MAGLSSSIFDLPNNLEQVRKPEDVIKVYTRKVIPKSNSTGAAFAGSEITFDFSLSANQYWVPSRSFCVIQDVINVGVGNLPRKPTLEGNAAGTVSVAPSFNCQDNLFDGYELTVGGFSLGSRTKLAPQISACEKRLGKSSSFLKGAGYGANTWIPSFGQRKQQVVRNGQYDAPGEEFKLTGTVTTADAANTLAGAGGAIWLDELQAGNQIRMASGRSFNVKTVTAANAALHQAASGNVTETAQAYVMGKRLSERTNINDRVFQPSLGVFKQGKALPPSRYELILRPKPDVLYKQSALEAQGTAAAVIQGGNRSVSGSNNLTTDHFEYVIKDIVFYVCIVENYERPPDKMTYVLDLEETECQPRQISGGGSTENFTVSKSCFGLSVALQDKRAGQNPLYSPSLFKVENDEQNSITTLRIDYAGQTRPNPAKVLALEHTENDLDNVSRMTWGFAETAIEDLAWYDTGGVQDKNTWRQLGNLFHYQFRKTGDDISTDVNVETKFADFANGPHNLLLFHHFRRVIEFTCENNQITQFLAQDA